MSNVIDEMTRIIRERDAAIAALADEGRRRGQTEGVVARHLAAFKRIVVMTRDA